MSTDDSERNQDPAADRQTDRQRRSRVTRSATPQRVRITSPRMGAVTRPPARSGRRDLEEQTDLGEVYVRSLVRTQLRIGVTVVGVTALVLGSLPLVFSWQRGLNAVRLLGIPLPAWVLGVLVYPALVAAGAWVVRSATRAERDFADIVDRS